MELFENLLLQRIYTLIGEVEETFEDYLEHSILDSTEIEYALIEESFFIRITLIGGFVLIIKEEYSMEHHRLQILYNYTLLSPDTKPVISYDNRPHHGNLETYPNHKHYYPKSKYNAMAFNGDVNQALHEMLWIIENSKR